MYGPRFAIPRLGVVPGAVAPQRAPTACPNRSSTALVPWIPGLSCPQSWFPAEVAPVLEP